MIHQMYFIYINIIKLCILKKISILFQINKVSTYTCIEIFIKFYKKKRNLNHLYLFLVFFYLFICNYLKKKKKKNNNIKNVGR